MNRRTLLGTVIVLSLLLGFPGAPIAQTDGELIYAAQPDGLGGARIIRIDSATGLLDVVSGVVEAPSTPTAPLFFQTTCFWQGAGDAFFHYDGKIYRVAPGLDGSLPQFHMQGPPARFENLLLISEHAYHINDSLVLLFEGSFRFAWLVDLQNRTFRPLDVERDGRQPIELMFPFNYDEASGSILTVKGGGLFFTSIFDYSQQLLLAETYLIESKDYLYLLPNQNALWARGNSTNLIDLQTGSFEQIAESRLNVVEVTDTQFVTQEPPGFVFRDASTGDVVTEVVTEPVADPDFINITDRIFFSHRELITPEPGLLATEVVATQFSPDYQTKTETVFRLHQPYERKLTVRGTGPGIPIPKGMWFREVDGTLLVLGDTGLISIDVETGDRTLIRAAEFAPIAATTGSAIALTPSGRPPDVIDYVLHLTGVEPFTVIVIQPDRNSDGGIDVGDLITRQRELEVLP